MSISLPRHLDKRILSLSFKFYHLRIQEKSPFRLSDGRGFEVQVVQNSLEHELYTNPEDSGIENPQRLTEVRGSQTQLLFESMRRVGDVKSIHSNDHSGTFGNFKSFLQSEVENPEYRQTVISEFSCAFFTPVELDPVDTGCQNKNIIRFDVPFTGIENSAEVDSEWKLVQTGEFKLPSGIDIDILDTGASTLISDYSFVKILLIVQTHYHVITLDVVDDPEVFASIVSLPI